jgi:4-hydroxy-2-oxoheptanedioate aldolase
MSSRKDSPAAARNVAGSAIERLRRRLTNGVEGLFVKLASTETLEIAAGHFDFCVIDLEHSSLGDSEVLRLLQYARAIDFPALLRLPEVDGPLIARALEAGAVGIQLSNVTRVEQVVAARQATDFPPAGSRSVSTATAEARFGSIALRDYVRDTSRCLLVVQVEGEFTDDPLAEILRDGVDVAFIGTSDLSVAVDFDDERLRQRIAAIGEAAAAAGIPLGAFAGHDERIRYRLSCSDISLFADALRDRPRPLTGAASTRLAANWVDIPDEYVRPGIRRRGFGTVSCLLVQNTCQPGLELRPHSHDFEQIALIVSGRGRYHIGEVAHEVGPGSVLLVPAGVMHYIEPADEVIENLDIFAPARADYLHLIDWMQERVPERDTARSGPDSGIENGGTP